MLNHSVKILHMFPTVAVMANKDQYPIFIAEQLQQECRGINYATPWLTNNVVSPLELRTITMGS